MVFRKLSSSLITLSICIIFIEGVFRLFTIYTEQLDYAINFDAFEPDSELIWRLKPNYNGSSATNEFGLRDNPLNLHADLKILLLGDSVSWGHGIQNVHHTFAYLLEQSLAEKLKKSVEVINSGVPGYSTFQQYRYLKLHGLDFKPDLILLQFCLNDVIERDPIHGAYGGNNIFFGVQIRHQIQNLHAWLLRHSRAYASGMYLAVRIAREWQEDQVKELTVEPLSYELQNAWETALSNVDNIRALAQKNNIPLVMFATPYGFQLESPETTGQPQKTLTNYTKKNNLTMVDLLPVFAAFHRNNKNLTPFLDANHLTAEGHLLTAKTLVEVILPIIPHQNKFHPLR